MKTITIIGAGLSGTFLTIQLLRQSTSSDNLSIYLIDRNPEGDMGPAYSTNEDGLLLNVPACRMGAFSNQPDHFLNWCHENQIAAKHWDFLPRKLYKEYVQELLQQAINENPHNRLNRIRDEVVNIKLNDQRAEVQLSQKIILSDKVVLALGNFAPRHPPVKEASALKSERYFQNPWYDGMFDRLSPNDTVLIIGTGQTMVDIMVRLHARNHHGKVIAISRRGYLPLEHTSFESYPSFYSEIIQQSEIATILRIVRKHFSEAAKKGMDVNAVLDSIRPYTQELWMKLPAEEKNRFLRHLFRYFEIVRSRIPIENMRVVKEMVSSGQLTIEKGRIHTITPHADHLQVHYVIPPDGEEKIKRASIVINATGPELDYTKIDHPLIRNLISNEIIQPDPMGLGINSFPDGAIKNNFPEAKNTIYTLGSTMRGTLWEVIAVPEIRVQAEQLATLLLEKK